MAKLITVYWREIPAQVIAKRGRESAKVVLADRFQVAIDRAAMRAGTGSSDHYLADWKRVPRACGGDLGAEAAREARRLEALFDDVRLERMVKAGGVDPHSGEHEAPLPRSESDVSEG